jgi:hypothetical protein
MASRRQEGERPRGGLVADPRPLTARGGIGVSRTAPAPRRSLAKPMLPRASAALSLLSIPAPRLEGGVAGASAATNPCTSTARQRANRPARRLNIMMDSIIDSDDQ